MSNVTVGVLTIDLQARTAAFQGDLGKAAQSARGSFQRMKQDAADASRGMDMHEAKASLALLSEEVGVTIPRHLRAFIVQLPGVGAALNAAFSSVAVIALIGLIVEIGTKIAEHRKKLEEAQKAWKEVGESGRDALHKQEEELLALQIRLDELRGNHLQALKDKLKQIDEQTLDKIISQFDALQKKADEAFQKMQVGGFASFFGLGNDEAVRKAQDDLDKTIEHVHELRDAGKNADIGTYLQKQLDNVGSFKDVPFENAPHPEVRQQALNYEYQQIENLKKQYANLNKERTDNRDIALLEDRNKRTAEANAALQKQNAAYSELQTKAQAVLAQLQSADEKHTSTLEQQIATLQAAKDAEEKRGVTDTQYGMAILRLEQQRTAEIKQQIALQEQQSRGSGIPNLPAACPALNLPDGPKPIYTGGSAAATL
jgi:hypothetical protein